MDLLLLALLIALFLVGTPIAIGLLAVAAIALAFVMDVPATVIHQVLFGSIDKFALISVPFFLFAGEVMGVGGVSRRIVDWTLSFLGPIRGNRGLTTVGACTVFGAISGSSVATVAAVGQLMYPDLKKRYGERFASGLIASTGSIDILIPPSIAMILYGAAAQQSVPKLFLAGVLPGLVMAAFIAAYVIYYARANGIDDRQSFSWRAVYRATLSGAWALGAPVVVFGGMYGGIFSPTEAAGAACVYGIIVTKFVYRDISWRELWTSAVNSMFLTSQILIIVGAAGVYSWLLTVSGTPQAAVNAAQAVASSQWSVLLMMNLVLLVAGCIMDPASAILLLTPLFVPICQAYGIDLIHFGIIMTMNLAIGMFTPPIGLNIFVTQALTKVPLSVLYPGLIPFTVVSLLALLLVTYIPGLSLWLARLA